VGGGAELESSQKSSAERLVLSSVVIAAPTTTKSGIDSLGVSTESPRVVICASHLAHPIAFGAWQFSPLVGVEY
ncbi:LOW QUALITY PROTEIN: hypothetical protein PanWU01x14_205170, partial [Parasponia andersonii]